MPKPTSVKAQFDEEEEKRRKGIRRVAFRRQRMPERKTKMFAKAILQKRQIEEERARHALDEKEVDSNVMHKESEAAALADLARIPEIEKDIASLKSERAQLVQKLKEILKEEEALRMTMKPKDGHDDKKKGSGGHEFMSTKRFSTHDDMTQSGLPSPSTPAPEGARKELPFPQFTPVSAPGTPSGQAAPWSAAAAMSPTPEAAGTPLSRESSMGAQGVVVKAESTSGVTSVETAKSAPAVTPKGGDGKKTPVPAAAIKQEPARMDVVKTETSAGVIKTSRPSTAQPSLLSSPKQQKRRSFADEGPRPALTTSQLDEKNISEVARLNQATTAPSIVPPPLKVQSSPTATHPLNEKIADFRREKSPLTRTTPPSQPLLRGHQNVNMPMVGSPSLLGQHSISPNFAGSNQSQPVSLQSSPQLSPLNRGASGGSLFASRPAQSVAYNSNAMQAQQGGVNAAGRGAQAGAGGDGGALLQPMAQSPQSQQRQFGNVYNQRPGPFNQGQRQGMNMGNGPPPPQHFGGGGQGPPYGDYGGGMYGRGYVGDQPPHQMGGWNRGQNQGGWRGQDIPRYPYMGGGVNPQQGMNQQHQQHRRY